VQYGAGTLAVIAADVVEVVIDATGAPAAGIGRVLACCRAGRHIVMVNVEADAQAGPLQGRRAREAGVVYSLAYGGQPALIGKPVDWARAAGFEVIAAGKGTKYLSAHHQSTPATVWQHDGLNAQMSSPSPSGIWWPANGSTAKGGDTVFGHLMPATLALRWDDGEFDAGSEAVRFRREMEAAFAAVPTQ
jgi:hypothetical protein